MKAFELMLSLKQDVCIVKINKLDGNPIEATRTVHGRIVMVLDYLLLSLPEPDINVLKLAKDTLISLADSEYLRRGGDITLKHNPKTGIVFNITPAQ